MYADAFPSLVNDISLYVFDKDSLFVTEVHDGGEHLDENYRIDLPLDTGSYILVAWGGHDSELFEVPTLKVGSSSLDELYVKLRRDEDNSISRNATIGGLFYGNALFNIKNNRNGEAVVHLLNNTKNINVVIQSVDNKDISSGDYTFKILENNGWLDYNSMPVVKDDTISYYAYYKADGEVSTFDKSLADDIHSTVRVVKAELNTLRLIEGKAPRLVVVDNKKNRNLLDINLLEYMALLKPQHYVDMSNQEFFDRTQECNIVFFLSNGVPVSVEVRIGAWKVVRELDVEL